MLIELKIIIKYLKWILLSVLEWDKCGWNRCIECWKQSESKCIKSIPPTISMIHMQKSVAVKCFLSLPIPTVSWFLFYFFVIFHFIVVFAISSQFHSLTLASFFSHDSILWHCSTPLRAGGAIERVKFFFDCIFMFPKWFWISISIFQNARLIAKVESLMFFPPPSTTISQKWQIVLYWEEFWWNFYRFWPNCPLPDAAIQPSGKQQTLTNICYLSLQRDQK